MIKNIILFLNITLTVCFLASCKTNPAKDFPEIPDITDVAQYAPPSPEREQEIREILEAEAAKPFPPYTINGGDKYGILVFGQPDLSISETEVTPDGYISIPMIDPVKISGLQIMEAKAEIEDKLKVYLRKPNVTLVPHFIKGQMATVAGKVNSSGRYTVEDNMRLADLIALCKGFPNSLADGYAMELADFESSVFVRGQETLPVDFKKALNGDPLHNVKIHGGDYVYIGTRANKQVGVIGEVQLPRYVPWYENIGVLECITNCRGLKDEYSAHAIVIRGGITRNPELYRVDIQDVLDGKKPNPGLLPGDILYIPKDSFSEYNVFIRKLMPTAQFINMLITPYAFFAGGGFP